MAANIGGATMSSPTSNTIVNRIHELEMQVNSQRDTNQSLVNAITEIVNRIARLEEQVGIYNDSTPPSAGGFPNG